MNVGPEWFEADNGVRALPEMTSPAPPKSSPPFEHFWSLTFAKSRKDEMILAPGKAGNSGAPSSHIYRPSSHPEPEGLVT
jgi:hypothetical protein